VAVAVAVLVQAVLAVLAAGEMEKLILAVQREGLLTLVAEVEVITIPQDLGLLAAQA
jgi:hypothetical protein